MKTKLILVLIVVNSFVSCAQTNLKNYQCIEDYLQSRGIDNKRQAMVIKEKEKNKSSLRIFYGGDEISNYSINYRTPLFEEQAWKIMYKTYSADTIVKHWKSADFPNYNFIFQNRKGLWTFNFFDKYENNQMDVYFISEPMYYKNDKYIIFEFSEGITGTSGIQRNQIIIMTKENDKWKVVETVYDYILH